MKPKFVDTNIFIRFLTNDDKVKAKKCFDLFQKAKDKEVILTTTESILSEVVYILSSKRLYKLSSKEIYDLFFPIINLAGLKIGFKKIILEALEIYAREKVDFEDALSAAFMKREKIKEIYSYDRDFDRFSFIKRKEP
jgi:predicted nucleic acid-binding protein